MKLYAKTDVGRKREINQDYVYVTDKPIGPFPNLLVVADGMGGHKAGDFASKYTVKILREELEHTSLDKPEEILRGVVTKANHELIRAAHSDVKLEGMGTTLVAGTIVGNTLYFANVGDSRLYVIQEKIHQVTKDHSLVQEMVRMGELKEEEREIILRRYYLGQTQTKIAAQLGISQVQVSRLEKRILKQMRQRL